MKRRQKILAFVALAFVTLALFAGCGPKQVTLKVLNYQQADQAGYQEDLKIWQDFQKANPGIKLDMEVLFNDPYHQKLQAYAAAGTLPDVFYIWPGARSAVIHEKKLAKDLTQLLGADYLKDFSEAATNPNNQLGKYLAELPQSFTYTSVMYVNVKLLKDNDFDPPTTYEDLKKMVPTLKAKGLGVMLLADKDGWPAQSCLFSTIVGRIAGDAFLDEIAAGKASFTDAPFMAALEAYQNFIKDGIIQKTDFSIGYGEAAAMFASGKTAIYIDGDWRTGAYITDKTSGAALISPEAQKTDFELMPLVSLPGEKNPGLISAVPGTGWAVSASLPAGSDKEKAAVKLVKYLYSQEVQAIRYGTGAYVPTRKGVKANVEPLPGKLPQFYADHPATCYVIDGVFDPAVYNVLNNELISIGLGTSNPAKAAENIKKAFDSWKAAQK